MCFLIISHNYVNYYSILLLKYQEADTACNSCFCTLNPVGIYLLKFNDRNPRTRCEICSKLTIKAPERQWRRSGVFVVNFEHISHISHLVLVLMLLTLNM